MRGVYQLQNFSKPIYIVAGSSMLEIRAEKQHAVISVTTDKGSCVCCTDYSRP